MSKSKKKKKKKAAKKKSPQKDRKKPPQEHGVPILRPGLKVGAPPPFHELPELQFQDLCREIVAYEETVSTCSVYGVRGQRQKGIDLVAQRRANDGIEVVQCKCFKKITPAKIKIASKDFLDHWPTTWQTQKVKRFILAVACDLSDTKLQDEILTQTQRFRDLGLQYEAWSAHEIQTRLTPHPAIVARHLHPEDVWVRLVCGPANLGAQWPAPGVSNVASGAAGELVDRLSAAVGREIDHIRTQLRDGRLDEAAQWLAKGLDQATVASLSSKVQARILRLQASITLQLQGQVEGARALSNQADRLDAEAAEGARLRAILVNLERGPAAALAALGAPVDVDGVNLQGALLIQSGDLDAATALLAHVDTEQQANAETYRLRAHLSVMKGELADADRFVSAALRLAPHRESVRLMLASVRYSQALCGRTTDLVLPWPRPIEWWQVRRDDMARSRLAEAHRIVGELLDRVSAAGASRRVLETWRVACLANDPERQGEARELVASLLGGDPGHTRVIAWAVARNLGTPPACRTVLEDLVRGGTAEAHHVVALLNIYMKESALDAAEALHKSSRAIFEGANGTDVWQRWGILLLHERGKADEVQRALNEYQGPLASELRRIAVSTSGRAEMAVRELDAARSASTTPKDLFELCNEAATRGGWSSIAHWANALVALVPTPEAVQLAATSLFKTHAYEPCVSLVRESTALFPHGRLPVFLRMMLAQCLAAVGGLPAATREADQISTEQPTTPNLLALIELHQRQGDLAACAVVARRLAGARDLTPDQLLHLAQLVHVDDRPLARGFWRRAVKGPLRDERVSAAVDLARRLGEAEDRPLLASLQQRLTSLGREGKAGVVFVETEEQLRSFIQAIRSSEAETTRLYRRAEAPLHVLLSRFNVGWVAFFRGSVTDNQAAKTFSARRALYVRHGARPRHLPLGTPGLQDRRLNLDISSVLVLENLGLLETALASVKEARIAQETMPLLGMERTLLPEPLAGWTAELLDKLRARIQDGRLGLLPLHAVASDEDSDLTNRDDERNEFDEVCADCLLSLLAVVPERNDVMCVDDRFLSRYSSNRGVPVVGVLELLDALHAEGRLSTDQRLAAIARLRSWNVRHLALDVEELLWLLTRSPVERGRVVESGELRVLRSYVAASLLDEGVLQFPPMPADSPTPAGETEYVMGVLRSTHSALLRLFRDGDEYAEARANWTLEWLLPSLLVMAHSSGAVQSGRVDPDELTVLGLSHLITLSLTETITVDLVDDAPSAQRARFVRWLDAVLEEHFSAQPALRARVWEQVRGTLTELLQYGDRRDQHARAASQLMARQFMRSLPPSLEDLALRDPSFLSEHGLVITRTLTIQGVSFANDSFHSAIVEAVNGRPGRASLADGSGEVEFSTSIVGGLPQLAFSPANAERPISSRDPAFGVVSQDAGVRKRSLLELRSALGSTPEAFADLERHVMTAPTPAARMMRFHELWDRSGEAFYGSFLQACERQEPFDYRDMRPPDAPQALTYFGLVADAHDLEQTARTLIDKRGLCAAVIRLSGVPCALPETLRSAFLALDTNARARLLSELRQAARTVLDGIRLLELATLGDVFSHPDHSDLGSLTLDFLLGDEGPEQFQAFEAMLLWTNSNFLRWTDTRDWSRPTRLAAVWMHSHEMLRGLYSGGADPVPLARRLHAATTAAPAEIFGQDREYWRDVAHPRNLQWPTFLAAALGMALKGSPTPWWSTASERFQAVLLVEGKNGRPVLHPSFLADTSLAIDHLGSFLRAPWDDVLRRLLCVDDPEVRSGLSKEALERERLKAVDALARNTADPRPWIFLYGSCRDFGFDASLMERLADILVSVDLVALAANPAGHRMALGVMRNFVASTQDRRVAVAFEGKLVQLAGVLAKGQRDPTTRRRDDQDVLEAALVLSAAEASEVLAVGTYVRVMNRLADADPALLDAAAPVIQRLSRWMPGQAVVLLVPLILRLRRDAFWNSPLTRESSDEPDEDEDTPSS